TNAEFAVGTPGYMCPEQARGEEMDHRGDLYSVGIILFELLTGQLPFAGRSTMDILLAHATEEPPSFAALGAPANIPPGIEQVVQCCLAKTPQQRPSNARELSEMYDEALSAHLAGLSGVPIRAGAPAPPRPAPQPARPAPARPAAAPPPAPVVP